MKRLIILLIILLLGAIVTFQALHYFRFSLNQTYDYPAKTEGVDLGYHDQDEVNAYYELSYKAGSFAREAWFNYGVDVRLKDLSDSMSINAANTYERMMVRIKQIEAHLLNSYRLKQKGYNNKDIAFMEENQLSEQDYELIRKFQGKEFKRGDLTSGVYEMQKLLNQLGQQIRIDGNFDSETEDAVRSFQEAKGLYPSGKADQITLKELIAAYKNVK